MKHTFNIGDRVCVRGRKDLDGFRVEAKFRHLGQPYVILEFGAGYGCHAIPEERLLPYKTNIFNVGDRVSCIATGEVGVIIGVQTHSMGDLYVVALDKSNRVLFASNLKPLPEEVVKEEEEEEEEVKPKFKVGDIVTYNGEPGIILRSPSSSSLSNNWVVRLLEYGYNETLAENLLTLVR